MSGMCAQLTMPTSLADITSGSQHASLQSLCLGSTLWLVQAVITKLSEMACEMKARCYSVSEGHFEDKTTFLVTNLRASDDLPITWRNPKSPLRC